MERTIKKQLALLNHGGERGIRTPDTELPYTRFPGVLLQPLGHLTALAKNLLIRLSRWNGAHYIEFPFMCKRFFIFFEKSFSINLTNGLNRPMHRENFSTMAARTFRKKPAAVTRTTVLRLHAG